LIFVGHLTEIDGRQILNSRFNDLHESVSVLVHCQQEDDATILSQQLFGFE
jgi:hypothetical protein